MGYGFWARQKTPDTRAFSEKAYKRQGMAAWEGRWHELSVRARDSFLHVVKGPQKHSGMYSAEPSVGISKFPEQILKELTDAGFVELKSSKSRVSEKRVYATAGLYDFATRVRSLRKFHLLATDRPTEFAKYVNHAFFGGQLTAVLSVVLSKAGIGRFFELENALTRYVTHRRWPGWVSAKLDDPLAEQILAAIHDGGGSLPLAELAGRIKGSPSPDEVRKVMDNLVTHLALVEDLRPETWELMVGFLPTVYEEMIQASKPRERPPLVVCERPVEVAPDGGIIVNDLRAALLEIATEAPQLRQDHSLYQKEMQRFQTALDPLPSWLSTALKWHDEGRVEQAITWARGLRLVKNSSEGKRIRLQLTLKGQEWLSGDIEEQHAGIYDVVREMGPNPDIDARAHGFTFNGMDPFYGYRTERTRFFGEYVTAVEIHNEQSLSYHERAKAEDELALREHLDRALDVLNPGVFCRFDSVASHISFGECNPLNRGLPMDKVTVFWVHESIPPLEEEREKAGRLLIDVFVRRRLIPLGCVRAAIDEEGRICVARQSRYDAYFGREVAQINAANNHETAAKIVVQPDFSVVVIGLNPAPVAALAPFCERATRGRGQGAMILKITRESVVRAVASGLKPEEISARLERHASTKVPANVLRQVRDWSSWVRRVDSSSVTLVRCPNSDTADRVMGALKNQAERVNDTLVAVKCMMLASKERNKLKDHGIIVRGELEALEDQIK
jgi:soluble cytochrome b562